MARRRHLRHRHRLGTAVGVLCVLAGACGGSDAHRSGADPATSHLSPATSVAATSVAAGAPATDVPATGSTVDEPLGTTTPQPTTPPSTSAAPATSDGATVPAPSTTALEQLPAVPRVLLVGDSTLLAIGSYEAEDALRGMDPVYEAASCRALGQPSCGDDPPTNSVEVIEATDGRIDVVVVMAGYDEWFTTFPSSFAQVVDAARSRGAARIVWLTYPEDVDYLLPDHRAASESLANMNRVLAERAASGTYPDVVVADWYTYSASAEGWFSRDGIHLSVTGALGVADYISRTIAFLAVQPCPMPRAVDGPIETPCPDPDLSGPVPDVASLYD